MHNKNSTDPNSCVMRRLVIFSREALFLGSIVNRKAPYRTTQELMVVCLQGSLSIRTGHASPVITRSCLIPPGTWLDGKLIESQQAVLGIYFLAPFTQDHGALASQMQPVGNGLYCDHANEAAVISAMTSVQTQRCIRATDARARIRGALIPEHLQNLLFREYDHRAVTVAKRIRNELHDAPSLASLAVDVGLSESRLEKLFKEQAGIPITQYRVRYRVFISTIIMALGYSITEAALLAGFSNSAHLSRCYRQINGVAPSTTFLNPPYVDSVFDASATALVEPLLAGQPAV